MTDGIALPTTRVFLPFLESPAARASLTGLSEPEVDGGGSPDGGPSQEPGDGVDDGREDVVDLRTTLLEPGSGPSLQEVVARLADVDEGREERDPSALARLAVYREASANAVLANADKVAALYQLAGFGFGSGLSAATAISNSIRFSDRPIDFQTAFSQFNGGVERIIENRIGQPINEASDPVTSVNDIGPINVSRFVNFSR